MYDLTFKGRATRSIAMMCTAACLAFASPAFAELPSGGDFVDKKYDIDGGWTLEKRDGNWVVALDEGFKTKAGPDLKIFLSPQSIGDVTGKTAVKGSVLVSALQSNTGAQEYVLPASVNPEDFSSLLIHCEKFSVLWGGANI